nr:GGDEF domain-containing protein [Oleiagrimonas sp. C23AA]
MRLKSLAKKNQLLTLQQQLNHKKTETRRLQFILLSVVVGFLCLWLFRVHHSQRRFRHLARHDGLTGLMNHQHFMAECERVLNRLKRSGSHASLVLMDLDHFKQVNDRHGHATGDEVLRQATALCRQMLRGEDLFGRLGGEEFGMLLPGCTCEQGVDIANRIRLALADTPVRAFEDHAEVSISASFGLACTDQSGYDMNQLCNDADTALYRAKWGGRNRLIVADAPAAHPGKNERTMDADA